MIDRYAIYSDFKAINQRFGLSGEEFTVPNYNASPSQQLPVVANKSKNGISFFYWGTNKKWSNNKTISPKLLSASLDQLSKSTTLKNALSKRRCIVPVNGFYLWKQYGKKSKTPHYFYSQKQEILSLPGLWEEYEDMEGNVNYTFKIIEILNYSALDSFGTYMPSVLSQDVEDKWLDDYTSIDELLGILKNADGTSNLTNHPVSAHITKVTNNSPKLIQPQSQVDQLGNYTLFE